MNLFEYPNTNSHTKAHANPCRTAKRPARFTRSPLLSTRELRDEILRMVG